MSEREALVDRSGRAAFDAFYAEGTDYSDIERAMFAQVASAVLAELERTHVLVERGRWERAQTLARFTLDAMGLRNPPWPKLAVELRSDLARDAPAGEDAE